MNLDCGGTWQLTCKFHAPSLPLAAHELLLVLSLNYACLLFTGQSMEETFIILPWWLDTHIFEVINVSTFAGIEI